MAERKSAVYLDLSVLASYEQARCDMLIRKLTAMREYYKHQAEYFDTLHEIEKANEDTYGLDLDLDL